MNDRIPGTTYWNPIWYGRYRIYVSGDEERGGFSFIHDDCADSGDNRRGWAASEVEAKAQIDALEGID